MEIKFVWIQDYRNIKNIGFNFNNSNGDQFEYDGQNLRISQNLDTTPKGFFRENISSITAIVGKNGAGKTNLSEFLYYNLVHVRNGALARFPTGKGILILEKKIFIQETLKLVNEKKLQEEGYEVERYEFNPLDKKGNRDWFKMEANRYIYYNPLLDMRFKDWVSGNDNIQDISTTYLLTSDIYNSSKHYNNSQPYRVQKRTERLLAYSRNEKLRESDLILNYSEIAEFLPNHSDIISFSVDTIRNNQLLNLEYYGREEASRDKNKQNSNEIYHFLDDLEKNISYQLEEYHKKENEYTSLYTVPLEVKKELFKKIFYITFFRAYWKIHASTLTAKLLDDFFTKGNSEFGDDNLDTKLKAIVINLDQILVDSGFTVKSNVIVHDQTDDEKWEDTFAAIFNKFELSLNKKQKQFKRIISNSKSLLKDNLHFHYQFENNYSSGEQKLLNFYARLFYAKNEIKFREKNNYNTQSKRIVLFIDEGEVGMHPEWQRLFFSKAIEFISRLFDEYIIQIIFTTHSPFILSELPNSNVIFLNKNKFGNTELVQHKTQHTFGGNIYSLFADSFFMDNGTIGAFSKKKIEWVLTLLESEQDLSHEESKTIEFIISRIGEPIIKMELEELFKRKEGTAEIDELKNKIKNLEKELRNKTNDQTE
ncbi:hypothetical protein APR41_05205 [Salegentibacter salinarum]|uniref:ATPase AAA-type core domain-containing protein n=1 Tax=Salegentibacter salinarum TaxID=447422 RepID=A0A2N0TS96_9FLAO|nr:AAA family ATPase [Salegentibacter salinarum]PKD17609.1 hypothetical protein APR41_05205 [Salegentibacter salinarum]SKB49613.1 AAA domain-containing protein, putative AbiEii toxin, Type IV TA system [Salegentibacter salinarum]